MDIKMEKALEGDEFSEDDGRRYVIPVREFCEEQFVQEALDGDELFFSEEKRKIVLVVDDRISIVKHDIKGKRIEDRYEEKRSSFIIGSELRLRPTYDRDFVLGATLEIVDKKDKTITSVSIDLSKMMEAISKILAINNDKDCFK